MVIHTAHITTATRAMAYARKVWSSILLHGSKTRTLSSLCVREPRNNNFRISSGLSGNNLLIPHQVTHGCVCSVSSSVTGNSGECSSPLSKAKLLSADIDSSESSGKYLTVKWESGKQSHLFSKWLRQNCHCPECVDPGSNQRKVFADKLVGSPRLDSTVITGNCVKQPLG